MIVIVEEMKKENDSRQEWGEQVSKNNVPWNFDVLLMQPNPQRSRE